VKIDKDTHVFGLGFADPSIPWPARGSAEKELCERDGWERRTIPTIDRGAPSSVEAMCRGQFAVNRMLGGDEGFAISLSASGYRLSYGGCVFARCADAMVAVEALMAAHEDWTQAEREGLSDAHRSAMRTTIKASERRGEIMLDRVYPT
jgi:hypothetical protein